MELLAWCGAALSCLLAVPQAARVLRAERLDGVSVSTYWIVLGNAAVWAAWALLTGEYAAGVPVLVNGPAAILILRRLLTARGKRRDQIAACSYGRPAMRFGTCRPRTAYARARWLDRASNTIMLRPTVGRLVASVTASDPLALPIKAMVVVNTHDNISTIRAQLRPRKRPPPVQCQPG